MVAQSYGLCTALIFNWLIVGNLDFPLSQLLNRNIRHQRAVRTRGTLKVSQSIEKRPQ